MYSRRFTRARLRPALTLSFSSLVALAGYERYNAMRADPALCFLEKVGMPDEKLLSAEQGISDGAQDTAERWAGDGAEALGALQSSWVLVRSWLVLRSELCLWRAVRGEGSNVDGSMTGNGEHRWELLRAVGQRTGTAGCTAGTASEVASHYEGLILCLIQGHHGKGRKQWRKAGGAAKAGGEWDWQ